MFGKNTEGRMKMAGGSDHGSDLTPVKGEGGGNQMEQGKPQIMVGLTKIWPT